MSVTITPNPVTAAQLVTPSDNPSLLKEQAKALWLQGLQSKAIAAALGVTGDRVRQWIKRNAWTPQRNAVQANVEAIVKNVVLNTEVRARINDSRKTRKTLSLAVTKQAEALAQDTPTLNSMATSKAGEGSASVLLKVVQAASVVHAWGPESDANEWADLDALDPEQPAIDIESVKVKAD